MYKSVYTAPRNIGIVFSALSSHKVRVQLVTLCQYLRDAVWVFRELVVTTRRGFILSIEFVASLVEW